MHVGDGGLELLCLKKANHGWSTCARLIYLEHTHPRQGHNAPSDNWILFDGTSGSAVVVRIAPPKEKPKMPAASAVVMEIIDCL